MAEKKQVIRANPIAPEVYADRASSVTLRGNVARITLASDRMGSDPATPESTVAGHVAMSVRGFLQLYGQMQSVVTQMQENGLISQQSASADTAKPATKRKTSRAKPAPKRTSRAKK